MQLSLHGCSNHVLVVFTKKKSRIGRFFVVGESTGRIILYSCSIWNKNRLYSCVKSADMDSNPNK